MTKTRFAGVAPRAAATLIDWGIIFLTILGLPLLYILIKKATTTGNMGFPRTNHSSNPLLAIAIWVALSITYYIAFEATLAATPGKLLLGLRVRRCTGEKMTFKTATIRNLLRVVDAFPFVIPYLVGAIAIWTDEALEQLPDHERRHRRIGDRVAGTAVVHY